ncbi:sulfite exporter TauE/SafE family protein [Austwickia chelonae]|uniref:sulfite exporter TauE/SafE family protein n=1 Tax=Austwickia chelonae TaxID=100225 RepID=UPI000E23E09B|nr:sulfite exporter TauE/SafE family protein [Austwickia chelonae]
MLTVILTLIVLVNLVFVLALIKDLHRHRHQVWEEPGSRPAMAVSQAVIYFFASFGISDFAIGSALYPKAKWIADRKLPGTLNAACVIPVAVMALAYITSIEVDLMTLGLAVVAQVIGAFFGAPVVAKLPSRVIKGGIVVGLLVAAGFILMGKFGLSPTGGEATGLTGGKLFALGVLSLLYGALNNIGIGSFALTMATVHSLGMDARVALPIMMAACTFSVPIGSVQFIRHDAYARKLTLFSAVFGSVGVLIAVFLVKSLDVSALQWVVIVVIAYTATTMLLDLLRKKESSDEEVAAVTSPALETNETKVHA